MSGGENTMYVSSGTRRASENSDTTGVLNSNQPRRLSLVRKRDSLTGLLSRHHTPAPVPHITLSNAEPPPSLGKNDDENNTRYTRSSSAVEKGGNTAATWARGATLGRARARHASPVGAAAEASLLLQASTVADVGPYARTSTTTSLLNTAAFSPVHAGSISVASAAMTTHRTARQARHHSTTRSASQTIPRFAQSTVSSRNHLSALPPVAGAALASLPVPVTSIAPSEHSADPELATLSTRGPLLGSDGERKQKIGDAANTGVIRSGRTRVSDLDPPAEKPVAPAVIQGSSDKGSGGASGARTQGALSHPFHLGSNLAPPLAHHYRVTDPAPRITSGKRRGRVTLMSSVASIPEGTDGEPASALPPLAHIHSSSDSLVERLGLAANATEGPCSLEVLSHGPLKLQRTEPPQLQQQAMQACSLSQSMVDLSSAPQTPPPPATVTDVRECRLSALDTSQSNEGLSGANTDGEAVCTVIGTSLQAAWPSQLDVSATSGPLAHKTQQASAFPPPSPKYEPATLLTAKASPHPCHSSAGADGPLSAAALPQAAEGGATKPQTSTMPQCRSTCSCSSEGDSSLEHRLSSTSSSLSVNAIVDSQAHAQEQSASRRDISGAFPETAAAAHLPTPSPSVRRASSTSAATTPSSVGAATSLSASMRSIPSNIEAEVVVGTSTPTQPLSMRLPVPSTVAGSAVPTASEKSLSSHHSDSGSTLLEHFAVLHDLQAFLQWEEEEKESHTCELPHDRDAFNGVFERYHLSRTAAMTAAENDKFGALMCPTHASDHSRERTEDEESLESSVGGLLRGTDTTGHAPITPRLRSRIEKVQQQELEMLRTVPKERHQDIVDFLDSSDVLMRELEGMDAARNGQGDGNRDPTDDVVDGVQAPHAALSPQKRPLPVLVSSRSSPTMSVARGSRVRPEGRPPVREVRRVVAPTTEKSGTTESVVRQYRRNGFAASSHSARARETNQAVPRASRRSNGSENGHVGNGDSVFISTPHRRLATEGGSRARFTPTLSCGALSDAIPPSPATALNRQVTVAAVGVSASTQDPRQRPPVSNTPISSRSEQPLRTAARRGDGYSGSSSSAGTSPPHKSAAPASDDLLPALFSAQEAANTITIVFDLDETLCNNRCLTRPILRPGAELLLHTLRGLCPSPRYKLIDTTHTHTRNQNVSNRLYDEAMYRMGMMPSYYSRVAQRQSANGYHRTSSTLLPGTTETSGAAATDISDATASAGFRSTGEARPATAKDKNPLRLELVLWTASEESLARRAMRYMDPLHKIFDEAIYRDGRWYRDSYYTKELSRLGRSMNRVVIVENSIDSVIRNRNNAILVTSFVRNRLDRQLFLVREVLRDWVWAMKAKLAHQQDAARAASGQRESIEPSTARDLTLPAVSQDAGGGCTVKCSDEGGESLVPPYSTPSAARIHRSESIPMQIGHIDTPIRTGDPIHVDPDGNVSLREVIAKRAASAPCCPAARAVSGSAVVQRATIRPLSAMARRASDIVEFLRHHRLILSDSNFLRFQLTAEVMMKLQTTEAALIAAALPPSPAAIEPADAQVVRTIGGVPSSRTTRGRSALPNETPPSPATAANSAGLPSKMLRSGTVSRALPNGGVASVGGVTADAAGLRTSMKEVGTATISTPPPAGSAARTTPDSHLDSPAPNSVACCSETHCDPARLQRTVSVVSKRLVTMETGLRSSEEGSQA